MNAAARPSEGGVPSLGEVIAQRSEGHSMVAAARPSEGGWFQVADLAVRRGPRLLFQTLGFALARGEALLLRGPNGIGKSTLLRSLLGLTPCDRGQIRLADEQFAPGSGRLRPHVLYHGHATGLKPELTVRENLVLAAELDGSPIDEPALRAALATVGLNRECRLPVRRLSQGQKQRLGLARLVLAGHRPLWLLDEPSAALDQDGVALLDTLLAGHLARGGSAVIATHRPVLAGRPTRELMLTPAATDPGAIATPR